MKTPFLGQAYAARSLPLASQTCVNLFPVKDETGASVGGFYGTPGLVAHAVGAGEVRGLWPFGSVLYAVVGSSVYSISGGWVATNLGTITSSTGRASMTDNGTQVLIAHSAGWHVIAGGVLSAVTDTDAPADSIVTFQDGYGITTLTGQEFGITSLDDFTTLDPLDFASSEGAPDGLISLLSDHRELWLFGERTTEVWYNSGAADFPFERSGNSFIEHGCAARFSPAKMDNTVFWVGRDDKGQGMVWRADGYRPQRISTHALEFAISGYTTISDAIGYTYQDEGHSFYVLTFPTADVTWVYDAATGLWHRRAWMDSDGVLHRHRGHCYAYFNGTHVVGDHSNGSIYELDLDTYTDDGEEIYRERAWAHIENENRRIRHNRMELVGEMGVGLDGSPTLGVDPVVVLEWSNDGGRTWSNEHTQSMGPIGVTGQRAVWRRLGMARRRVYRVSTTEPVKIAWLDATLQADVLA